MQAREVPTPARHGGAVEPVPGGRATVAPLTTTQRWLAVATGLVSTALAALGGVGSFAAVAAVAKAHGFTDHPGRVPLAVDLGIVGLILADLLLTWLDMPFPPLRWLVWLFVGATVWFNMAAAGGDVLGIAMHAAAPTLLVTWVEGVRHATRTRARMASTRRRHIEGSPLGRWLLAPAATARLWRRQQLWHITSYADALVLERQRLLTIASLRHEHGLLWRWKAPILDRYAVRFGLTDNREVVPAVRPAEPATPIPAHLARTFAVASLGRPTPASAPARPRPATRPRPAANGGNGARGERTDRAREWIRQRRAGGGVRPTNLHLQLRDALGLERTYAKRLVDQEWPEQEEATVASPDDTQDQDPAA
jgi:Protein of unknown function (DUF2637)